LSEWNYDERNIYKFIQKKYKFPTLISEKEIIGKEVIGFYKGREHTYVFFDGGTAIRFSSSTDYDRCLDSPQVIICVDHDFILDMVEHKVGEFHWSEAPAYVEMCELIDKFHKSERKRKEQTEYLHLKEKFEK